jgi:sirohydrochlorin ferrochelatase
VIGTHGAVALPGTRLSRPAAPIVLAAHGSRDPASAATMIRLAAAVGRVWPAPVVAAFLDFDQPSIPDALRGLPGCPSPVVVPALLTQAYHGRVDLPLVLDSTDVATRLTPVLGLADPTETPDPLLVSALRRRLSELDTTIDGLVLIAAGTSDATARSTVDAVAAEMGRELNVACMAGYASASSPTAAEAVAAVRAAGARRIAAATYFLAPGRLYSAAAASARAAGAVGVAAPLGAAAELVRLIVARATAAEHQIDVPVLVSTNTSHS